MSTNGQSDPGSAIAIVGMACRFPGARNPDQLWRNLRAGVESIEDLTDEELLAAGVPSRMLADPAYVKRAATVEGMDRFDHEFFRVTSRDAAIMDPQHRHFLEVSWEALEASGHAPDTHPGRTGVFAGCGANTYFMFNLMTNPALVEEMGLFLLRHTGNDKDFFASRVAYHLDLVGPAVNVQTACSSSLAAVHLACQSLLSHECDMALAGGATIRQPHRHGYLYREGEMLSPDGRCRAFDAEANGTVIGDGVGAVVLRRLDDAVADGDLVWAVLRGTAMNNDGSRKAGYLAPGPDGQAEVIAEAMAVAGADPASIGYVEGHSTGTPIGDAIEVEALTRAFRKETDRKAFCGLGSIKANLGHLDTASGVASLIKAALILHHGEIPPTLHFREPGPATGLDDSPFRVVDELTPWPSGDAPRRVGVSSLGIGGTNVHAVLEEAPQRSPGPTLRPAHLLVASARTPDALARARDRLVASFQSMPDESLPAAEHTLHRGRRHFPEREFVVARSAREAARAFASADTRPLRGGSTGERPRSVAFFLGDCGDPFPPVSLRELYHDEPGFRAGVEAALSELPPDEGEAIRSRPFLEGRAPRKGTPPCIVGFITQIALAEMWKSWGITPERILAAGTGRETAEVLEGRATHAQVMDRLRGSTGLPGSTPPVDDLDAVAEDDGWVLLDLGAEPSITVPSNANSRLAGDRSFLSGMPDPEPGVPALDAALDVLGRLWLLGVRVDWDAFHHGERRRLPLPTYPFEPVPHYISPGAKSEATDQGAAPIGPEDLDRIRVELESEAGVGEATVTLHEDASGEPKLVAHVVPEAGRFLSLGELRRALDARLPAALAPRQFAQLERLPRRSDGGIDVDRLHDPFAATDDHVAPASPTERAVAEVWIRLLGADRVSIHDNFLDLGGSSLLSARAVLAIGKRTGVELSPSMLNLHTLGQISAHIDRERARLAPDPEGEVEKDPSGGHLLSTIRRLVLGGAPQ